MPSSSLAHLVKPLPTARRLDGSARRAVVTGAAGGIGRAITDRLRSAGMDVVTLDVCEPADVVCDLARDPLPTNALRDIDVCVSNAAAVANLSPAHRMSADKWQHDLDVNLTGAFRVVQACLPGMRERRYGRIVAVSSIAATIGAPGQVAYAASKAGLIGMIRTIAAEELRRGISANCVLPGLIATPKVLAMPQDVTDRIHDRYVPSGRLASTDEVAGLIAYLASPEAGYVTAQAIAIDGGASLNTVSLGSPDRDALT